ncbi:MAG TPA: hypothetical protein VLS92_07065 [Acidimicrobiia bacterium]|nr:hypothetical protein [Acidimicrobiia bacterium]
MEVTGLSHPYCAMIRRGAYISHLRHWQALLLMTSRSFSPQ